MIKQGRPDQYYRSFEIKKIAEDLRKLLNELGYGRLKIYEMPKMSEAEKRLIQLEAIKRSRNNKGK